MRQPASNLSGVRYTNAHGHLGVKCVQEAADSRQQVSKHAELFSRASLSRIVANSARLKRLSSTTICRRQSTLSSFANHQNEGCISIDKEGR